MFLWTECKDVAQKIGSKLQFLAKHSRKNTKNKKFHRWYDKITNDHETRIEI